MMPVLTEPIDLLRLPTPEKASRTLIVLFVKRSKKPVAEEYS
jgi:hypothetical protein